MGKSMKDMSPEELERARAYKREYYRKYRQEKSQQVKAIEARSRSKHRAKRAAEALERYHARPMTNQLAQRVRARQRRGLEGVGRSHTIARLGSFQRGRRGLGALSWVDKFFHFDDRVSDHDRMMARIELLQLIEAFERGALSPALAELLRQAIEAMG